MLEREPGYVRAPLDLRLGDFRVTNASIGYSAGRTRFAFTIELPSDTMVALDDVAEKNGRICLLLPDRLLLDHIALERKGPHCVRIAGRIIDPLGTQEPGPAIESPPIRSVQLADG